ncbi:MAG: hypothetical protein WC533_03080 [Candidatus Pacearchaeota archaeon]
MVDRIDYKTILEVTRGFLKDNDKIRFIKGISDEGICIGFTDRTSVLVYPANKRITTFFESCIEFSMELNSGYKDRLGVEFSIRKI